MWVDAYELTENCPKELEEDLDEMAQASAEFLDAIDIYPNQNDKEVGFELEEAHSDLMQIMGKFLSMISDNYEEPTEKVGLGYKFKFEESMTVIIDNLRNKEKSMGIVKYFNQYFNFAGELRTTFLFIIYYPILTANKKKHKSIEEYFKTIFKLVSNNASVLGQEGKPIKIKSSKRIFPSSADLIIGLPKAGGEEPSEEPGEVPEEYLEIEEELGGEDEP